MLIKRKESALKTEGRRGFEGWITSSLPRGVALCAAERRHAQIDISPGPTAAIMTPDSV